MLDMQIKCGLRSRGRARELDACTESLEPLLLPVHGNGAPYLDKAQELVAECQQRFGFAEIRHVSLVVYPTRVEPCAGFARTQTADYGEGALCATVHPQGRCRHAHMPLDDKEKQALGVQCIALRRVQARAKREDRLHHVRIPRKRRRKDLAGVGMPRHPSDASCEVKGAAFGEVERAGGKVLANRSGGVLRGRGRRPRSCTRHVFVLLVHSPIDTDERDAPYTPNPLVTLETTYPRGAAYTYQVDVVSQLQHPQQAK